MDWYKREENYVEWARSVNTELYGSITSLYVGLLVALKHSIFVLLLFLSRRQMLVRELFDGEQEEQIGAYIKCNYQNILLSSIHHQIGSLSQTISEIAGPHVG